MDDKKRGFDSLEGQNLVGVNDNAAARHVKRKTKFHMKDVREKKGRSNVLTGTEPVKPMEKNKSRKAFDKKRRGSESKHSETKFDQESKDTEDQIQSLPSPSSVLPEFHIGVFRSLTSTDVSARVAAAESLVTELYEVQKAYERVDNKENFDGTIGLEAGKDDGLSDCAPSVRYAVRRLIRGVSSSRECARQGFALGLTMLIGRITAIKIDSFFGLISNLLEISSSMKGQEARDCLLGHIFAYGALVRSERLKEEWTLNKDTPYIKEFTRRLISLTEKKQYLQEPAVSVLLELLEQLPEDALLDHVVGESKLQDSFEEASDKGNPDALLLALKLQEKISINVKFGNLLSCPFHANEFFSADHISSILPCLKGSTFCQPRIHTLWPILVKALLPDVILQDDNILSSLSSDTKNKKNRNSFLEEVSINLQTFYEYVIDGCLLLSSHDRKHLAFNVMLLMLDRIPASFIQMILSSKVVQCLMDVLASKDSWLHKIAQNFLLELSNWAQDHDARKIFVVVALQKHSNGRFDSITRTRTVRNLMAKFETESGCVLFVHNLMRIFLDDGCAFEEEPSDQSHTTDDNSELGSPKEMDQFGIPGNSDFLKAWVIDSLPGILKNLKLDLEAKFRVQKEILKFLAVQGLFSASLGSEVTSFELQEKFQWPKTASSSSLCRICIEQLQVLLSDAGKGASGASNNLDQTDLGSYFMRFVSTLHSIPSVSFFRPLSKDEQEAVRKLQLMENALLKSEWNYEDKDGDKIWALRYLLIQLLLHVLIQPGEFLEAVSEIITCCKFAFWNDDAPDGFEAEKFVIEPQPFVVDVLIDTLISMLPQSSAPLRCAIEQVFKCYCRRNMSDDVLMQMLRIIKRDLKPARNHESEDEDDDDEDMFEIDEAEESNNVSIDETAESEGHTESEVGERETIRDNEFNEDSDESDGGMDDEAMFRMDSYLVRLFNERRNQVGAETTESQIVLFKLRVLSLLEIYLHENSSKTEVITVYSHLLHALVSLHIIGDSEQLGQRIYSILRRRVFRAKRLPYCEAHVFPTLTSLLKKNLKLASRPTNKKNSSNKQSVSWNWHKTVNSVAEASIFWILKIISSMKLQDDEVQKVCDVFQAALVDYFHSKKLQMKSELLKEIFRRRPWIAYHLFGFLLEKCVSARSEFLRVDSLGLITDILKLQHLASSTGSDVHDDATRYVETHLSGLGNLLKEFAVNVPRKQSRRIVVRKSCLFISQVILDLNLGKSFMKKLSSEVLDACRSQFGDQFLVL